ncbi:hypothetical protein PYW08_009558 [Mythimna loreyi]|uniref:Uncharacterized protein n=1 Tax=Mythimna loreyi TaxID=667449 RepID=A0ACC2Q6D4_9NEOP|nr:hypothetical protein PYW08_009558 [Mythimna loreyi]
MYLQLIISSILINFGSSADLQHISLKDDKESKELVAPNGRTNTEKKTPPYRPWNHQFWKPHKGTPYNLTYIDRAENLIRLPSMSKYEEKKIKKKTYKKSPKRTIQKIIKKNNRSKIKKVYVVKMTSSATVMPRNDLDNEQDDYPLRNAEMTTRPNQQKKIKKYSVKQAKLPRYPMPYRQMQTKKSYLKRPKREARDMFIFKDFDSMQFLKPKKDEDDDYNVVDAYVKNYW